MDAHSELFLTLSSLLASGKYSDFTIITQTRRFPVHKALLCPRSHFFESACSGQFLEATNNEVDLSEEDPEAVEQMIQWFYQMDYLTEQPVYSQPLPVSQWRQANQSPKRQRKLDFSSIEDPLFAVAKSTANERPITPPASPRASRDELQVDCKRTPSPDAVPTNNRRARSRVHSRPRSSSRTNAYSSSEVAELEPNWMAESSASDLLMHARVYSLAEKFGVPTLKALAKRKFETESQINWEDQHLVDAMEEIYTGTMDQDRGLRDVAVHLLRKHEELMRDLEILELAEDVEGLGNDVACIQRGIPIAVA